MSTKPKWVRNVHESNVQGHIKAILCSIKDTKYVVKTTTYKEIVIFYILNSEEPFPQLGYFTFARLGGAYNEILDMGDSKNILKILDDYFKKPEPFIMDAATRSPLSGGEDTSRETVKKFVANNPVVPKEGVTPVDMSGMVKISDPSSPDGWRWGHWPLIEREEINISGQQEALDAWKLPVLAALLASQSSWRYAGAGDFFLAKLLNMDKESIKSMKNELIDLYKGD